MIVEYLEYSNQSRRGILRYHFTVNMTVMDSTYDIIIFDLCRRRMSALSSATLLNTQCLKHIAESRKRMVILKCLKKRVTIQ